ncbi:uncharacterized protein LOC116028079 [Ipomoea triloba]|uniref:uncharacterized protein LOC116028079 n=1 Tax=Ipomoea triloba TaxID=35885 RepID=UPI00125E5209|nr:uncharacterized protein LOC116028079 [Ipomoea triloba]
MAACNEDFCSEYAELKPEEASFFDCLRILFSPELGGTDCVDTNSVPAAGHLSFRSRWLIFISVVAQKILIYLKDPLAWLGSALEIFLNYPSFNGGVFWLVLNFLTGKIVRPETTSENFRSFIANMDVRVDLDRKIKNGDSRYAPLLSIMAAKLSYENEAFVQRVVTNNWKMEFLEFYNFENDYADDKSTQAIMFQDKAEDPNLVVVAFRGTEPFNADDWRTDLDLSWYKLEGVGKLHAGFMRALGLQQNKGWPKEIERGPGKKQFAYYEIREKLREILRTNENAKFVVTGHSLGGALAILFAAVLIIQEEEELLGKMEGVYTFGQPRVGDVEFGDYMVEKLKKYRVKYFRYVYANDMVPRLPYDDKTYFFKHFGSCIYYNSLYNAQVLEEEPNKNYFSLLWVMPKMMNAGFELMRGFMLPWINGGDYREGWVLTLGRMAGLLIPGISDHGPEDYVNLTRLGTPPESLQFPETVQQQGLKRD